MPKIFVSYRRKDSQERAHRIADWLVLKYGKQNVFIDADRIPGATDFAKEIERSLEASDVLVVVIGYEWVKEFERRAELDEPDYVHLEVSKGLSDGMKVIPVLLERDVFIDAQRLPEDIRHIASLNYMYARSSDFHRDMDEIRRVIRQSTATRGRGILLMIIPLILIGIFGVVMVTNNRAPLVEVITTNTPANIQTQAALLLTETSAPTRTLTPDATQSLEAVMSNLLASETVNAQNTQQVLDIATINAGQTQTIQANETDSAQLTETASADETAEAQMTQAVITTETAVAQAIIDAFTDTPVPTDTDEPTATFTDIPSPIPTDTPDHTATAQAMGTADAIETQNAIDETNEASTQIAQLTDNAPTNTPVPTDTPTDTSTPTATLTETLTPTDTPSNTPTITLSPTETATETPSNTPSATPTDTPTHTPTIDRTATAEANDDATATQDAVITQVFEQALATENAGATQTAEAIPLASPELSEELIVTREKTEFDGSNFEPFEYAVSYPAGEDLTTYVSEDGRNITIDYFDGFYITIDVTRLSESVTITEEDMEAYIDTSVGEVVSDDVTTAGTRIQRRAMIRDEFGLTLVTTDFDSQSHLLLQSFAGIAEDRQVYYTQLVEDILASIYIIEPPPTATPRPSLIKTTSQSVNVRSEPDADSDFVRAVSANESVEILGFVRTDDPTYREWVELADGYIVLQAFSTDDFNDIRSFNSSRSSVASSLGDIELSEELIVEQTETIFNNVDNLFPVSYGISYPDDWSTFVDQNGAQVIFASFEINNNDLNGILAKYFIEDGGYVVFFAVAKFESDEPATDNLLSELNLLGDSGFEVISDETFERGLTLRRRIVTRIGDESELQTLLSFDVAIDNLKKVVTVAYGFVQETDLDTYKDVVEKMIASVRQIN